MAPKKTPPPPSAEEELRQWLTLLRRELTIAAYTALGLTAMFLVHRWTTGLLGKGLLQAGIFSGGGSIDDLVTNVERIVLDREEARGDARRPRTQRSRADGRRPGQGETSNDGT